MNVEDCLRERILRVIPKDVSKMNSSLKISELKLEKARELLNSEFFNESLLSAYTSMFHAARALLYYDGFQEKSHYAVYIYLGEKYSGKISKTLINIFYTYQKERHNVLYGFDNDINKEYAEEAVSYADEFLLNIKQILKS